MGALALRSLRYRSGSLAATFLSAFLGAALVMAFGSLLDTAAAGGVSAVDRETLVTMALVVGGWGAVIVAFAVASTLAVAIRRRESEMALLKSIGATPAQVGRMVVGEAVLVAAVAAGAAVVPALGAGRLVFGLLRDAGQVDAGLDHRFGPIAVALGLAITLVATTVAAVVTSRRATRRSAREALVAAAVERPGLSRPRRVAAGAFLVAGASCGTVTATVYRGEGPDAMQTGGQAAVWASVGLALLAPALVRLGVAALGGLVARVGGASGYLAVENLRRRSHQMAAALMPIVVFVGIATATLTMQAIENRATAEAGLVKDAEQESIETLNFVVVGMIAVFAAIMLVNGLVAATAYRRREFAQERLAGATPPQVLRMVAIEASVLALVGAAAGVAASLVTVVPYSLARADAVVPEAGAGAYGAVVAAAAALTVAATLGSARRAVRAPAVAAAAV